MSKLDDRKKERKFFKIFFYNEQFGIFFLKFFKSGKNFYTLNFWET